VGVWSRDDSVPKISYVLYYWIDVLDTGYVYTFKSSKLMTMRERVKYFWYTRLLWHGKYKGIFLNHYKKDIKHTMVLDPTCIGNMEWMRTLWFQKKSNTHNSTPSSFIMTFKALYIWFHFLYIKKWSMRQNYVDKNKRVWKANEFSFWNKTRLCVIRFWVGFGKVANPLS